MAKLQVENTIKFYESQVSQFPSPESWAVNILNASKRLTSGIAQTNFYRYLFNPEHYSFQSEVKTISKTEEEKYNRMVEEFDKNNVFDVKYYRNGQDVKIVYLNKTKNANKKTKSLAGLSATISSETQNVEYETGHESGSQAVQIQKEEKIDD